MANVQLTHVPYKGSGPALTDLIGGQVGACFNALGTPLPHVRSGRLRGLAVVAQERVTQLPEAPTFAQAGFPAVDSFAWFGLLAPAGTPREIVSRMQQETAKALAGSELKGIWQTLGAEAGGQSPEEMARFVDTEIKKWAKVVKDSGAKLD